MNRSCIKILSCLLVGAFFAGIQTFAEDAAAPKKDIKYKFRYNKVPVKQPTVTASMKEAVAEYSKGDYVGAMVDLKKVVEQEENNTYAKYYLALCYTQLGYKSEAQNLYQQVIASGDSYALTYYSQKAVNCMEGNGDGEICMPKKKVVPPDFTRTAQENGDGQPQSEEDDMTKFIKSGKKIHPAAMDRISRERAERKMQSDIYSKQQAEQDALNQAE